MSSVERLQSGNLKVAFGSSVASHFFWKLTVKIERLQWRKTWTRKAALPDGRSEPGISVDFSKPVIPVDGSFVICLYPKLENSPSAKDADFLG